MPIVPRCSGWFITVFNINETSSVSILWLDASADYNQSETTRGRSMGGMPLAIANGFAQHQVRRDSKLAPPLPSNHIVTVVPHNVDRGEQYLLDKARVKNLG